VDTHAGLYVHVPFCRAKCAYCTFSSVTAVGEVSAWVEAVLAEADRYRDRLGPFGTLYVGGGTPSLLGPAELRKLLGGLRARFSFAPGCEITLEANPEDVLWDMAALWRDEGIERISVGVQSFDDVFLKKLGRRHTARQALTALETLRRAGCANLSVDLMWALPGQTLDQWERTLEEVLSFEPEHLSCYELTVEEGTPLAGAVSRDSLPDEASACVFFRKTSQLLRRRGYIHYEISNYARSPVLVSRHNVKYWRHVPYLGLGPAAHSFDGQSRWANERSLKRYVAGMRQGVSVVRFREKLSAEQRRLERLFLGFRTGEGVSVDMVGATPEARDAARRAVRRGLLRLHDDRLVPTLKGWLIADRLPLLFP